MRASKLNLVAVWRRGVKKVSDHSQIHIPSENSVEYHDPGRMRRVESNSVVTGPAFSIDRFQY